ncbi:MAG: TnpV protein [Agathobaculum sp.]|uniref:TnpV protein n=1 Tax=Agathobaculum sp. TaxID=2048138 RepID=UPI002A832507|nr:TnpV protein [Agathobaculum sp.]MDY3712757.1 TnpV protein [Agathobaculum sp.]
MQYDSEQYHALVVAGGLNAYLNDVERQAQEELEQIVQEMAQKDGTDEALKARDPMKWLRLMNN